MTFKTSISMTDDQAAFARGMVESGHFPSLSALVQHAVQSYRDEVERKEADLEMMREFFRRRIEGPFVPIEEMDGMVERSIARMRAELGLED